MEGGRIQSEQRGGVDARSKCICLLFPTLTADSLLKEFLDPRISNVSRLVKDNITIIIIKLQKSGGKKRLAQA